MGHAVHIATIVGAAMCAHHFWPKGMLYGAREKWENEYRRRHTHPLKPRSSSSRPECDSREGDECEYVYYRRERQQMRGERERLGYYEGGARPPRERDVEYGAQPVYSRHARLRDCEYEYEDVPAYSRRASSRY